MHVFLSRSFLVSWEISGPRPPFRPGRGGEMGFRLKLRRANGNIEERPWQDSIDNTSLESTSSHMAYMVSAFC